LLNGAFQTPRAGQNDDKAHPPITPCKVVDPNNIHDATQRGVYTLVVKHYLACCSRDAIGKETSITVQMASEEFTARGLMILQKNWLDIYHPWERWSTGQGELPPVEVGSRVTPSSLLMKEGRTTAPQPISEVELISLMDRNGIGTDATIAQHITTIQDREYAQKDGAQRFSPTPLGIALVEGYNSMGYQLNKPDLRREMEHECNLVASAQKTKEDIIGPILNKMRQCYITATSEAQKLDDAVARHFPRIGTGDAMVVLQANFSECGDCQNRMVLKQERNARGRGGDQQQQQRSPRKLVFCNTCQAGWALPRGQPLPKTEENGGAAVKCPICSFQVIRVERGDGYEGNGYHVCPKCFTDSPPDHGGGNGGDFRCFSCTHPSCSLSGGTLGGDVEVFACPFCRQHGTQTGKITLRKNSRGFVLSCSNYSARNKCSYTVWLPRASQSVSIPDGDENTCTRCSTRGPVRKVSFVWKPGSVPPHLGRDCTVCILCDVSFRQDLQVNLPQMDQVTTNNRQRTRTPGGRNGSRAQVAPSGGGGGGGDRSNNSNSGGNVCFRCGQPGHYANACPRNT
jgi:DNA topoisomerase-3